MIMKIKPLIGISVGDPARIGPEVTAKTLPHLNQMWVSRKVLEEIRDFDNVDVTGETRKFFPENNMSTDVTFSYAMRYHHCP